MSVPVETSMGGEEQKHQREKKEKTGTKKNGSDAKYKKNNQEKGEKNSYSIV